MVPGAAGAAGVRGYMQRLYAWIACAPCFSDSTHGTAQQGEPKMELRIVMLEDEILNS